MSEDFFFGAVLSFKTPNVKTNDLPRHSGQTLEKLTKRHTHTRVSAGELRQHYYAAVSWADFATGQILGELDKLKLTEDTMVVLHSGESVSH